MFTAWCCTVVKVHCSPHRQTENVNNSWCDHNIAISLSVLYVHIEKETTGLKMEQLRVYRIMFLFIISIKAASIHPFTRVLMSTSSQLTDRRRGADEPPQINVLIFYFTRIKYLTYSAIYIYIYQQTHDFSFHSFSPLPYFLLLIGAVQLIKCH